MVEISDKNRNLLIIAVILVIAGLVITGGKLI